MQSHAEQSQRSHQICKGKNKTVAPLQTGSIPASQHAVIYSHQKCYSETPLTNQKKETMNQSRTSRTQPKSQVIHTRRAHRSSVALATISMTAAVTLSVLAASAALAQSQPSEADNKAMAACLNGVDHHIKKSRQFNVIGGPGWPDASFASSQDKFRRQLDTYYSNVLASVSAGPVNSKQVALCQSALKNVQQTESELVAAIAAARKSPPAAPATAPAAPAQQNAPHAANEPCRSNTLADIKKTRAILDMPPALETSVNQAAAGTLARAEAVVSDTTVSPDACKAAAANVAGTRGRIERAKQDLQDEIKKKEDAIAKLEDAFVPIWDGYITAVAEVARGIETIVSEIDHDQFVSIKNTGSERRKAYWTAAGCAGLKDGVAVLCHSEELAAGATGSYIYKKGTSSRYVQIRDLSRTSKNETSAALRNCDVKADVNASGSFATDRHFEMACTSHTAANLNSRGGGAVSNTGDKLKDRTYALTVRSSEQEPITFYYGSARCSQTVGKVKNVCRSITIPASGTVTIPVNENEKPTSATVGFLGKTRQAAERLKGRETIEINGGKLNIH
jgi:hypothetical protein